PITKISLAPLSSAFSIASSILWVTTTFFGFQSFLLVSTILILPGRSFLSDSYVFLPIITGIRQVLFLKYLKSFGILQGKPFFIPMMLFSEAATMCEIMIKKIKKRI